MQISAFFLFSNFQKRQIALYSPGWSVGWSVGWLVVWTVDWSVGRSVGCLVGRLVGRLVGWSVGWSVGWLVGRLVGLKKILKILEIRVVRVFMPLEVALVGHFVCMTRR